MSPEKQRIKIAEACGWKKRREERLSQWIAPHGGAWNEPPDYLNDLNAMAQAERTCKHLDDYEYASCLAGFYMGDQRLAVFATAAQRAEAFLKTLGLWEEEE